MNWQNNEEEIKRLVNSYEFTYDAGDWEAAQTLLLNRKRKRRILLWGAAALLVMAVAASVWLYPAQNKELASGNTPAYQNPVPAQGHKQPSQTPPSAQNLSNKPAPATPNTATSGSHNMAAAPATTPPGATTNQSATPAGNTTTTQTGNGTPTTPGSTGNGNSNIPQNTQAPAQTNNSTVPAITNPPGQTPENNYTDNIAETAADSTTTATKEHEIAEQEGETPETIAKTDENKNTENTESKTKQVRQRHALGLVVGGNYNQNKSNNIINSPYFGALYHYQPGNSNWLLGGGLGFTILNTTGLQKELTGWQHGFGITQKQLSISTHRMQYIEMPLFAKYNYKTAFNFMGGINPGYLINTTNTLQEYNYNPYTGAEETRTQTAAAYMHGLSRFDVQLQLGAEAALTKNLWLGFWANGGLLDVGRNTYYNNAVFERNMRLQLYIRYDVFKF